MKWVHGKKYKFKFGGVERIVTHDADVPVPWQYEQGTHKILAIWCRGYYTLEPNKGAFVAADWLTPLDGEPEENEFGRVCP